MTKAELIERIARSRSLPPNITKRDIAQVVGIAFEEIAIFFCKAKVTRSMSPRFTFPRFGTFTKKRRSARRGVNPRTLEPMQIDACHTLDFKASRELREAMNVAATPGARTNAAETGSRGKDTAAGKPTPKRTARGKRKGSRTTASTGEGTSKRKLTPRDEHAELAELDALIGDEALFDDDREHDGHGEGEHEGALPESPLQRVKGGSSSSRVRTG